MPLDPAIADQISAMVLTDAKASSQLTGVIDRNAVQALTVVNTNLLHQHGGTGDDAATIAALQTAAGTPRQGMDKTA